VICVIGPLEKEHMENRLDKCPEFIFSK